MSTTEETFTPALLQRSDTINSTINVKPAAGPSTKTPRPVQSHPRIDFEPLYADLKALIGHNWGVYYDSLTRFIRGKDALTDLGLCTAPQMLTP